MAELIELEIAVGSSSRRGRPSSATSSSPIIRKCSRCSRIAASCSTANASRLMKAKRFSIAPQRAWISASTREFPREAQS